MNKVENTGKRRNCFLNNFSFCHNVFKSCMLQRHQKASVCGKGLSMILWNFSSFPTYRGFLTLEYFVAKKEIAHNEQFFLLPDCFQLYLIILHTLLAIFYTFTWIISKSSAADLFYVEKVNPFPHINTFWCLSFCHRMFSTLFNYCTLYFHLKGVFEKNWVSGFQVVCCRFVVCGKWG